MKKILILLLALQLMASEQAPSCPLPWFTGTLIPPTGTVIPLGQWCIESYLYVTTNTGTYNKDWSAVDAPENFYSINPQWIAFFGLTPWCDINIIPQFFWNNTSNQNSVHVGDFTVGLDFQLMGADYTPYFPGIKFAIREVFPSGHYQKLNARKLATDATGAGTYGTQFGLEFYKIWHVTTNHWMTTTFYAQYQVSTPVHVQGISTYGGDPGTHGTVLPGNSFQGIISFEFSLTKNWVFALDNVWVHTDRTRFFGDSSSSVGSSSSEQLSFAPAIEYNFDCHFGIIAGCWLTATGRNSTEFRSGVINFNYVY